MQANVIVLSFALNGTLLSTAEKAIILILFLYLLVVVFIGTMSVCLASQEGSYMILYYLFLLDALGE